MEIVSINAELYERMLSKLENFVKRMETLCNLHADKDIGEWLDNQDVCFLLNISPRTLQTLRDNDILGFSRINRKVYYKPEDVKKAISVVKKLRKEAAKKGKQI